MQSELLSDIFNTAIKSIVSITVLFFITKPIRKKHIAQLTFFDYIAGIAIGSIAGSFSVEKDAYYTTGLTALIVWGLFAFAVAYISMKSLKARHFLDGTPTIFIQNGRILDGNLKKEKININDLLEELRLKGVFNLADVEFAILEADGEVSVQMKSQKRPLTPDDMHIPTRYQGLTANLIIDGSVMQENLHLVNRDEKWLKDELSKRNITSEKDVLLAALDTEGGLYISMKGNKDTDERRILG
ncbi:MAG: DUF421 domain-containing protein [Clostridiales bacterium]|jgi:uncharacterized membrane protein YcaP (DUF421 family)|nr:DUF421 domain-containing protein [Eubacteriales bacterium]MDH7566008.1 DUF421 domain-containing protein [Clostridiales bacterium]